MVTLKVLPDGNLMMTMQDGKMAINKISKDIEKEFRVII